MITNKQGATGPAVAFRDVVKVYHPDIKALDHVSFDIQPGETVALLGPNGAGKSTAIDTMLVLHEPTAALDVAARRHFWQSVETIARQGTTVLFATHYLEEADANATRIIVVNYGRVIADGTPARIKAFTATRTLRFAMPAPDPSELLKLPGVTDVLVNGDAVTARTGDADETLPALYALGRKVRAMEVGGGGLEEALIALTSADNGSNTERVS